MEIKTERDAPKMTVPKRTLIYGPEKIGKSTLASTLPNCAHLITEKYGGDYLNTIRYEINSLQDLKDFRDSHIKAGYPHEYIAIDTITAMEEWALWLATEMYMHTSMGKSFNKDPKTGKLLPREEWNHIIDALGQNGYGWFRKAWRSIFDDIIEPMGNENTKFLYIGHVKDKFIDPNAPTATIKAATQELDLTGKLKDITTQSLTDCVGYMYSNSKGERFISFQAADISAGTRVGPKNEIVTLDNLLQKLYNI